jgi:PAS domain S-box-containing protein
VLDHLGSVAGWSDRAHELLGYSAEEALGRRAADFLVDRADREVVREAAAACVADGGWFGLLPVRGRDGRNHG